MIDKIFSYFKSNNKFSEELTKLRLEGNVFKKLVGNDKEEISSESILYMEIKNEKTYDYNLIIYNTDYEYSKDSWEKLSFPINNDLSVKIMKEKGRDAIVWEREKKFYIFYPFLDSNNKESYNTFIKLLATLITSYAYEIVPEEVKAEDSQDYIMNMGEVDDISKFLEENYSKIYSESMDINAIENKAIDILTYKMDKVKIQHNFLKSFPNAKELFREDGILYQYDDVKDILIEIKKDSMFKIYNVEAFKYYIVVDDESVDKTLTCTSISQETNIVSNRKENLIMWLSKDDGSSPLAFNFVFYDTSVIDKLNKLLAKTHYESGSLSKFEELKEDDREWLENINEINSFDDDEEMELELDKYQESESDNPNKATAQAYLHDRTFVIRENNTIGVYKTDENDVLSHLMNLPSVKEYDNNVNIKNAKMFYSDTNMIFLDKDDPGKVYRYDLPKGKIVEEWTVDNKIDAIAPEKKYEQMANNPLLQGVNKNNLFTMDTRLKNKVVNIKSYKTNPKMNCLATTETGGIAVGSLNGEIRLFSEVGKNAKTLLPCFGDPIRSVDVTGDGKFVLATCDRYLILISTTCKGDKLGFDVQMGKEKSKPKILKIKANDIAKFKLDNLVFAPSRFNINKDNGETNIITSLGDYVINWNFNKIKKGILDDYKIKRVYQNVVDNQFKFNRNQIVLTMENKLRIQNQKMLFNEKEN